MPSICFILLLFLIFFFDGEKNVGNKIGWPIEQCITLLNVIVPLPSRANTWYALREGRDHFNESREKLEKEGGQGCRRVGKEI